MSSRRSSSAPWILAVLVACAPDDAGPVDGACGQRLAVSVCNPLAQTGCAALEKCTWFTDQAEPPIGHLSCACDGAIAVGGACTRPPAMFGAHDDCVKGAACFDGACRPLCDLAGGPPACSPTERCIPDDVYFRSGGTSSVGACR